MTYHKLIRDRIPEIIEASGKRAVTEILSEEDYLKALDEKLTEELKEYYADHSLEELADLLEVIYAVAKARGYSIEALHALQKKKADERGGFSEKLLLTEVID